MTYNELPDGDHVVRYARPTSIHEDGSIDGSEFRLRQGESGLSVNWLECFTDLTKSQQIEEVRRLSRLTMRRNGRLGELNVGGTKQYLVLQLPSFRFVNSPLSDTGIHEPDPSHSEITGLPPGDSSEGALVGDLIAECITRIHPAVL